MKHLEFHLYKDARHEVLNELNRDEVMNDVANFFDKCVERTEI